MFELILMWKEGVSGLFQSDDKIIRLIYVFIYLFLKLLFTPVNLSAIPSVTKQFSHLCNI